MPTTTPKTAGNGRQLARCLSIAALGLGLQAGAGADTPRPLIAPNSVHPARTTR